MLSGKISHYRIISKLGQGGMGEVYLAEDTRLNRKVAIKFIPEDLQADEQATRRLMKEAQAAATLDHPNICSIYEVGQCDGGDFIVMQYVEGETVSERNRRKPLDIRESVDIAAQVAEALSEAHSRGIIHRDLKPQNIMITARGHVKLLDFGLAKSIDREAPLETNASTRTLLTEPGMIIGTVPYMSPEQVRGEPLDGRSDIFSLGVVLYEILTGRRPFFSESAAAMISQILTREPPPIARYSDDAPPELQRIISKTLRKEVEDRYQTAKDLAVDLKALISELAFDQKLEQSYSGDIASATALRRPAVSTVGMAASTSPVEVSRRLSRRSAVLLAAFLCIVAAGVGYSLFTAGSDSLAVLPFTYDASGDSKLMADPDREYLADGITESIINRLSQLPRLKVIARSSVFRYKGKEIDAKAIGRELGVRTLLTGTIKQNGDNLTISYELLAVSDNRQLLGDRYEKRVRVSDLLTLQGEISSEISEKLRMKLSGSDRKVLVRNRTDSSDAYQAYLKGRYQWNKRSEDGFRNGIKFFKQAIEIDPNYALAYAGLADCYMLLSDYGFITPSEGYRQAEVNVRKALELDGNLAEAQTSLAAINQGYYWNWTEAEKGYRTAIQINPNYPTARHWYALCLMLSGRMEEALVEIRRAKELDPFSLGINKDYGITLFFSRRYDDAINQFRKTLEIEPDFHMVNAHLAEVYLEKGRHREAISELERVHELSSGEPEITSVLGQAYAMAGRRDEALKIAEQLSRLQKENQFLSKELAILYARLGDSERALKILQEGVDKRHAVVTEIKVDPRLAGLRGDPRFSQLISRIGLPN